MLHNLQTQCHSCEEKKKSQNQPNIPQYSFYINSRYQNFPKFIPHHHITSICSNTKNLENAFLSDDKNTLYCLVEKCPDKKSYDEIAGQCVDPRNTFEIQIRTKNCTLNHFTILEASCKRSKWFICDQLQHLLWLQERENYISQYLPQLHVFLQFSSDAVYEHLTLKFFNLLNKMDSTEHSNLMTLLSEEFSQIHHTGVMEIQLSTASQSIIQYKEKEIDSQLIYYQSKLLWTEGNAKISDMMQTNETIELLDKCSFQLFNIWMSGEEEQTLSDHVTKLQTILQSKYALNNVYLKLLNDKRVGVWVCHKVDYSLLKSCDEGEYPVQLNLPGEIFQRFDINFELKNYKIH